MRILKILFYLVVILVLQTVVFARLNFFGIVPDLVLVSVIIFAVLDEKKMAIPFAAAAGVIQDILSFGIYLNTISKVLVATVVGATKESLLGNEYSIVASLVAIFTPVVMVAEGAVRYFILAKQVDIPSLVISAVLATLYNLVLVPVLLPLMRKLFHD